MNKRINNHAVILDTWRSPQALLKPIAIGDVSLQDGFWQSRILMNNTVTIPTQFQQLEKTGRLDNFRRVYGEVEKPYQGFVYNDSDVYKWLEAASWSMAYSTDEQIKQSVDLIITLITRAQTKDGYLNTYFSLDKFNERWTNLWEKHELYCAGHLIQAAIAHYRVTGEDTLLNVAIKLADHIHSTFGKSGNGGTCGHPEVEMALVELYRTTGQAKYLEQALLFLDRRGNGLLGGSEYLVDHLPFRKLEFLAGHAVRALYLCAGATDIAIETGEVQLTTTLNRLWTNMIQQQMYITGGLGAKHEGEAFGKPYELPNASAYAESCAAIASVMWNWRMLQLEGNPTYADAMEWTLYNAVLPGISLDGKEYFYVNPLKDEGGHRRQTWFECACCPPNISRTIAMMPGYMYSISDEGIWVHLYANSQVSIELTTGQRVKLLQTTGYPWEGQISLLIKDLQLSHSGKTIPLEGDTFSLFLRVPGWLSDQKASVKINDEPYRHHISSGSYLEIRRKWQAGDRLMLSFPMEVQFIESNPLIEENIGRVAITRGPIVYCIEAVDNQDAASPRIRIDPSFRPIMEFLAKELGAIVKLHLAGQVKVSEKSWEDKLYRPIQPRKTHSDGKEIDLISIPYYAWANREPGWMEIWHLL